MNRAVYKWLRLRLEKKKKNILMFVYVAKSSSPGLGTSIKQVKAQT